MILDYQMPKNNGLEVVHEVRKLFHEHNASLSVRLELPKFVFLTAFFSKSFRQQLEEQGLSDVYEKPLQDSQIYDIMEKSLKNDSPN